MEKITGIYKITSISNGKIYIGQSKNIKSRWNYHLKAAKGSKFNTPLYKDMRKTGSRYFKFDIIEECTEDKLYERERYWIAYYKSYINGYNLTTGGAGCSGIIFDVKRKESHRNASKTNKPILQFDFEGNLINEWCGISEAGKKLGMNSPVILACLTNRLNCKTAYGYIWVYKKDYEICKDLNIKERLKNSNNNKIYRIDIYGNTCIYDSMEHVLSTNKSYKNMTIYGSNSKNQPRYGYIFKLHNDYINDCDYTKYFIKNRQGIKKVKQYDLNNNFIKEFDSQSDACLCVGINPSCISECLHGKQLTAGGYIWKR